MKIKAFDIESDDYSSAASLDNTTHIFSIDFSPAPFDFSSLKHSHATRFTIRHREEKTAHTPHVFQLQAISSATCVKADFGRSQV
jgi:hypothetical protein